MTSSLSLRAGEDIFERFFLCQPGVRNHWIMWSLLTYGLGKIKFWLWSRDLIIIKLIAIILFFTVLVFHHLCLWHECSTKHAFFKKNCVFTLVLLVCFYSLISVLQSRELLVERSEQTDSEGGTVPEECGDLCGWPVCSRHQPTSQAQFHPHRPWRHRPTPKLGRPWQDRWVIFHDHARLTSC